VNLDITPQPWMQQAACTGKTADLFYPERHDAVEVKYAVAICQACPVREQCLAHAIATGEDHGVWGGLTPGQRWDHAHGQAPRRKGRPPTMKPIVHGTAAGFHRHYAYGEKACQPCLDAHAEYKRPRRAGKNATTAERIAAIPHGTPRGYRAHHRLDTPPCRACRDAWNADKRNRRNQKKAA
jgi:WhiB family transcriptional regulator, redox-sensing transcriptional regulator